MDEDRLHGIHLSFHRINLVAGVKLPSDMQVCFPGFILNGQKISFTCEKDSTYDIYFCSGVGVRR